MKPALKPGIVEGPSRRHEPVRATSIPSRLAAEVDRTDDRLPMPSSLSRHDLTRFRSAVVYRLAAFAQLAATKAREAENGGQVDDLCDVLDDLEACASETVPWLRAARGERGTR